MSGENYRKSGKIEIVDGSMQQIGCKKQTIKQRRKDYIQGVCCIIKLSQIVWFNGSVGLESSRLPFTNDVIYEQPLRDI